MKWFLEQILDMSPGAAILFVGYKLGIAYAAMVPSVASFGLFILTAICLIFAGAITVMAVEKK